MVARSSRTLSRWSQVRRCDAGRRHGELEGRLKGVSGVGVIAAEVSSLLDRYGPWGLAGESAVGREPGRCGRRAVPSSRRCSWAVSFGLIESSQTVRSIV